MSIAAEPIAAEPIAAEPIAAEPIAADGLTYMSELTNDFQSLIQRYVTVMSCTSCI